MVKLNIWQIDDAIREKWNRVNEIVELADGEVTDEARAIIDEIDDLDIAREKKIEGAVCIYKEQGIRIDAIDLEIKRLQAEKKKAQNEQERLKAYISYATAGEKFSSLNASVSWRKSTAVVFDDLDSIPNEYIRFVPEVQKADIKTALKNGVPVAGARLEERTNIIIK